MSNVFKEFDRFEFQKRRLAILIGGKRCSQERLAREAECGFHTVRRAESGDSIPSERMAKALYAALESLEKKFGVKQNNDISRGGND